MIRSCASMLSRLAATVSGRSSAFVLVLVVLGSVGLTSARRSAPRLNPQYYIVAQFVDANGPAVQLANGRVFRLDARPRTIVPHLPEGHIPSGIIDSINRIRPGTLPDWFVKPPRPTPSPKAVGPTKPEKPGSPSGTDTVHASREHSSRPPAAMDAGDPPDTWIRPVQYRPLPAQAEIPGLATRVRYQGARDACTWFAATLGLEAAYVRLAGVDVDLSEQYYNNILKMHLLYDNIPLPLTEDQVGLWGGGSVVTNLSAMATLPFGIPEEAEDPYQSLNNMVRDPTTRPPGDILFAALSNTAQRAADDVNLPDTPVTLANPAGQTFIPLPVHALEDATYRATSIEVASEVERQTPDWYRQRLSNQEAIVIAFHCCGDGSGPIWTPAGDLSGGHAAVLIGYDDSQQAFLLRNSWGENSARLFSYDFVTGNHVYEAVDIKTVAPVVKGRGLPGNLAVLLGRWLLTDAAQPGRISPSGTGLLDIYRLPGADKQAGFGRLGTFFAENGTAYRVNGRFVADSLNPPGQLEFVIDTTNADAPFTASAGTRYVATYMFETTMDNAHSMMVGSTTAASGAVQHFVLRKRQALPASVAVPLSGPRPADQALIGWWEVYWEGEVGTLVFTRFNPQSGKFIGYYEPFGGQRVTAWGAVNGNDMIVLTDLPNFRLAIGGFADLNQSVASGHWERSNPGSAFVAMLRNPAPVIILPLASGTLGPVAP